MGLIEALLSYFDLRDENRRLTARVIELNSRLVKERESPRRQVFSEISDERQRQIRKFGDQIVPHGTGKMFAGVAAAVKMIVDSKSKDGTVTMSDVLLEEVFEALESTNVHHLRTELIQVAAVAVKWVELIDRSGK